MGLKLRRPELHQADALGALFLDGYRGTIDDEGEDLEAAVAVASGFFAGANGPPDEEASVVAWRGATPVGACLVAWWDSRSCPFIAFIVTAADAKRAGVGSLLLGESVRRLSRAGNREVRAVITEGNTASIELFEKLGFARVPAPRAL